MGNDPLTGLKSRSNWELAIIEEEVRALAQGASSVVVLYDLDLKEVNESQGYLAGNSMLISFSEILAEASRDLGSVYRIGGGEFGVILPNLTLSCSRVFVLKVGAAMFSEDIRASIGVAACDSNVGFLDAVRRAERAMLEHRVNTRAQRTA